MVVTVVLAIGATTAAATPDPNRTEAVLLLGTGFACHMVDDGGSRAWVYCWEGGPRQRRHVKLDAEGQVSLAETAPIPTGLGGPGHPYGTWEIVGRFRCETQRRGVECVLISTGKGFRISGTSIVEVQSQPGIVEPTPVLATSIVSQPVSGAVRVKEPGTGFFTLLNSPARLPLGTVVDTTRGTVQLTSAADSTGATQAGLFHSGVFRIGQPAARSLRSGQPEGLTVLTLVGKLPACGGGKDKSKSARDRASIAARRGRSGGRRLWGDAHGDFQTGGRYASATVVGTKWLTRDTCAGTLVAVARGAVSVNDFVSRKTVVVAAGHKYLARQDGNGPSPGGASRAPIWSALDGKVVCGLAIHPPKEPVRDLLCFARPVPPPKRPDPEGDPGFVFLHATGNPRLAKLSQYSFVVEGGWEPQNQTALGPGRRWANSAIGVHCTISVTTVRCANRSGHGFAITTSSYDGF